MKMRLFLATTIVSGTVVYLWHTRTLKKEKRKVANQVARKYEADKAA